jgi:hypothetical protein
MIKDQEMVYKNAFYNQVTNVLAVYPNELVLFQKYWNASDYRHAYLIYHEAFTKHTIDERMIDKKIDSDFYWSFVN